MYERRAETYRVASCRAAIAAGLIAIALGPGSAALVHAADKAPASKAPASAPALPETLTQESARDLLSRLSDEQVRTLLLEQLDKSAPRAKPADAGASMSGVAGTMDASAGIVRARIGQLSDALLALPVTTREAVARLTDGASAAALWTLGGYFLAMLVAGWLVEAAYDYGLRRYRAGLLEASAPTFSARAFQLGLGLVLDLGGILVFALAALAVFAARWLEQELQRMVLLLGLLTVVIVRVAALSGRFLLAPEKNARLLPFADAPAGLLRWFLIGLAAMFGVFLLARSLLAASGAGPATLDVVMLFSWAVGLALVLGTTWAVRQPVAELIRGDRPRGTVIGWIADLWPVLATGYFLALLGGQISDILSGRPLPLGRGLGSVLVIVLAPLIDMALRRALAAAAAPKDATRRLGVVAAYEPIFRRGVHIVVVVVALLLIANLWDLDLILMAQHRFGGNIAGPLLGISIVLLAAHLLWEIAKAAIDRRLKAEGELKDDVPASRLRTLLPILRLTILATIFAMAAMSILAALGVDILPLLAGASVVGVAIGFGSQTLVRDIVSGAFFLMDDAFRLGEYLEIGDAKGRVEKINVRSVFLRHHRGALNILPYGEIKRLRNTSRDWQIHVLEFRLTYDTNMLQVKKILKQIGEELAADADYAPDILQPLKSAGVISAEESAIVVRAKFTARPGSNAWVIRRMAYDKIIRAFRAAGIKFAHAQVTVEVPAAPEGAASVAGAAAAALSQAKNKVAQA
ncbi:MAG: mechanosensitive ion channel family protein [Rudaea sp.]